MDILSFNQVKPQSRTAYIDYWANENHQGQGLLSYSLQAFIHHYTRGGLMCRFVVRYRVTSTRNNWVVLRNRFILGGCLRRTRYLNSNYDDQNIYVRAIDHDGALEGT